MTDPSGTPGWRERLGTDHGVRADPNTGGRGCVFFDSAAASLPQEPMPGTQFSIWFPTMSDRDDPLLEKVVEVVHTVAGEAGIDVHVVSATRTAADSLQERADADDLDVLIAEVATSDLAFAAAHEDAGARSALLRSLVERRRVSGLSQTMVAERMGTTQSAVSELEGGATDPRLSTLQRYARAVGVRVGLALDTPAGVQVDREALEVIAAGLSAACEDYAEAGPYGAGFDFLADVRAFIAKVVAPLLGS